MAAACSVTVRSQGDWERDWVRRERASKKRSRNGKSDGVLIMI